MTIYDLLWIEQPASPRTVYQHNAIALLVFAFGIVPAFGGFGYAVLTVGPDWLFRILWFVPGVIVWSIAIYAFLCVMRHRSEPQAPSISSDPPHAAPFVDSGYCTHEYPNGAYHCIYCGAARTPATSVTIRVGN